MAIRADDPQIADSQQAVLLTSYSQSPGDFDFSLFQNERAYSSRMAIRYPAYVKHQEAAPEWYGCCCAYVC
jgi:hypothetical protein